MKPKKFIRTLLTISALIGFGLIFIGGRFLFAPEAGERGYGLNFAENGDYSFHYIKGIRDLFSGLLILALALLGRRVELAVALGLGALIPLVDCLVILSAPNANQSALWIHGGTAVAILILGASLMFFSGETDGDIQKPIASAQLKI